MYSPRSTDIVIGNNKNCNLTEKKLYLPVFTELSYFCTGLKKVWKTKS